MSLNLTKFPFYRLPVLALQEVIKSMELDVMFFYSLTSTKAQKMLKISLPKNYLHLDCYLAMEKKITVESPSSRNKLAFKFCNSSFNSYQSQMQNVHSVYFTNFNGTIEICRGEPLEVQVHELIINLAGNFNFPKISMNFQTALEPQTALELLNNVKSLSLPMVKIELGTETSAEIYKGFLDEGSRITESLIMGCISPIDFQYTPSQDFHLERFEVRDGDWVNLEDYINCRHVIVHNVTRAHDMYSVNAQRLNQFFKNWQRSGCQLERLQIDVSSAYLVGGINFDEVIAGLNGTNIIRDQFEDSVNIERQDGKKATILLTTVNLTLEIKS